jgi:hypothetical protein
MNNFWMGLLAAQAAAADTKPVHRRQRVLSVLGGIALALLIGGGLATCKSRFIAPERSRLD